MTMTAIETQQPRRVSDDINDRWWLVIVGTAVASCGLQLWWFARTCLNEIDFDGMGYIGMARHIRQGEFHAAINSIRSPLISWLIAAASFGSGDFLRIGKLVNVASFLLTLVLLYFLAKALWHSRLAAAAAALLFTLGRALAPAAVESITPDFLFASLAIVYFLLLLRALRNDRLRDWFSLGAVHGLAFLSKAFALPWLAVCTVAALVVSGKPWKTRIAPLAAAALIPAVIAAGWATVLHSKYGVFTTGSQFRLNLLQWTLHVSGTHRDPAYTLLRDTSKDYDEYVVLDMPPGSWAWSYPLDFKQVIPKAIAAEGRIAPLVVKEMIIVATPGGCLAFVLALVVITRRRQQYPMEWRFGVVTAVAALSLVAAYSMLVFDSRYLFPLIPLVLVVATGFLAGDREFKLWRRICLALVIGGTVFSITYRSSPFRTLTRDFQDSCRDAGNRLRTHRSSRIVSVGSGPFPEHGVGWEAGYKAAYFAGSRIVGGLNSLPDPTQASSLAADIEKASPDAILVWGRADDHRRASVTQGLVVLYWRHSTEKILDPALGEVGVIVFPQRPAAAGTVATVN